MAVRIYSLAKELKVDSKELVDICTQVGIKGKGSALASLDDEEVAKLRAYYDGSSAEAERPADRAAPTPQRPPEREKEKKSSKMPVLRTAKPVDPVVAARQAALEAARKKEQEEAAAAAASAKEVAAATTAAASAADDAAQASAESDADAPRRPGPLARVMQRGDYVSPGNVSGKPPVLDSEPKSGRGAAGGKGGGRARPAVKLAPIPQAEPEKPLTK